MPLRYCCDGLLGRFYFFNRLFSLNNLRIDVCHIAARPLNEGFGGFQVCGLLPLVSLGRNERLERRTLVSGQMCEHPTLRFVGPLLNIDTHRILGYRPRVCPLRARCAHENTSGHKHHQQEHQ